MLGKVETATTPVVAPTAESSDTESDTESEKEDEEKQKEKEEGMKEIVPEIAIQAEENGSEESTIGGEDEKTAATGFGEIFSAELQPNTETLQTATSFVDISDEPKQEEEARSESSNEDEAAPALMTGGTAAGLFDASDTVGGTGAALFGSAPAKPGLSTGDAIFSDMPAVPDIAR